MLYVCLSTSSFTLLLLTQVLPSLQSSAQLSSEKDTPGALQTQGFLPFFCNICLYSLLGQECYTLYDGFCSISNGYLTSV